MGRLTPARAGALLAACVLIGLAFVSVPTAQTFATNGARDPATHPATIALAHAEVSSAAPAAKPAPVRKKVHAALARPATGRRACPAGLVALTFDDGPSPSVTPRLVRTLVRLRVPATFFMVGSRVEADPGIARLVQRSGFTIGNHTWSHPELTHLSSTEVRTQVLATSWAFRRHDVATSRLARPPFGEIDARVRRVYRRLGMVPVMWTIDSRDWAGGSKLEIAHRILGALRPHRTNLVLQHDGVENSLASLAAVPIVVRGARARGYCFAGLDSAGRVDRRTRS